MAKKKKPVETIDVVEVKETEIELPSSVDEVEVEVSTDVVEPEVLDTDGDTVEIEDPHPLAPEASPRSGVLPLIFGGVVAAALGFTAARSNMIDNFLPPSWRMNAGEVALQEQISSTQSRLATLNEKLTDLASEMDGVPVVDDSLATQISELTGRLTTLENRPATVGTDGGADLSGDFAALRATAEKQQAEIDALLADARLAEQTSNDAASNTLARAAATRVVAAIESGAPFATALDDLEATGVSDIPEVLRAVSTEGVVTLVTLQGTIPDAARAALAASPPETGGGLGGFIKRQLGARSVAPREGSSPDAILSRVEGAVRQGRLTDALAEAETLPQEAQSAMSDWIESATSRLAVTSASETLMQRLVAN